MSMFCSKCGKQVRDGMNYCTNCGEPVKKDEGGVNPVFRRSTMKFPTF